MLAPVRDKAGNWLNQSFMVSNKFLESSDARMRLWGDAAIKYTDSSLGGNWGINSIPQFTETADIDSRYMFAQAGITNETGVGRYWSLLDDYAQLLHIRAGVPEYNSLFRFFTSFYNAKASMITRLGRMDSAAYQTGAVVGMVVMLPVSVLFAAADAIRWLTRSPASKFYYLKPTMSMYWTSVTSMANHIGVNLGMVDPLMNSDAEAALKEDTEGGAPAPTAAEVENMIDTAPELYWSDGSLDVYAVANRATRQAYRRRKNLEALMSNIQNDEDFMASIDEQFRSDLNLSVKHIYLNGKGTKENSNKIVGLHKRLEEWMSDKGMGKPLDEETKDEVTKSGPATGDDPGEPGWYGKFIDFAEAELSDGSAFVSFYVNNTGSASDSISNATAENALASEMNSFSNTARTMRISFAEGKLFGGVAGDVIGSVAGGAVDFLSGMLDNMGVGGAKALFGNAFVDIPKNWDSSTTNLSSLSFRGTFKALYGNKRSIYQDVLLPTAMLLALACPRSTGRHSYTSPFLVEAYCQGVGQTRLGVVSSLTLERGAGNIGWTVDRLPLQVDWSITIEELSTIFHMPIGPAFNINPTEGWFDEDSIYSDYMNTLSALGLSDQIYIRKRWNLNMRRKLAGYRTLSSPARWASWFNDTSSGRVMNAVWREIDRI